MITRSDIVIDRDVVKVPTCKLQPGKANAMLGARHRMTPVGGTANTAAQQLVSVIERINDSKAPFCGLQGTIILKGILQGVNMLTVELIGQYYIQGLLCFALVVSASNMSPSLAIDIQTDPRGGLLPVVASSPPVVSRSSVGKDHRCPCWCAFHAKEITSRHHKSAREAWSVLPSRP